MKGEFDSNQPIYQQIMDRIIAAIAKGELAPGAKVASVRELALEYNVNPNTMQKSLAKLEEMGYLYTERTSGRYVTRDFGVIDAMKAKIPEKIVGDFVEEMIDFGIEKQAIPKYVKDYIERMDNNGKDTAN
jgi:DNA-binding transcriptional regulator YhcF (GntR family)